MNLFSTRILVGHVYMCSWACTKNSMEKNSWCKCKKGILVVAALTVSEGGGTPDRFGKVMLLTFSRSIVQSGHIFFPFNAAILKYHLRRKERKLDDSYTVKVHNTTF